MFLRHFLFIDNFLDLKKVPKSVVFLFEVMGEKERDCPIYV